MSIDAKWQSTADYLAEFSRVAAKRPPEGAFAVSDVSEASGGSASTFERKLKADVRAGVLETGMFLHNSRHTRFYWLAK
jgi:hypothetical protein